MVILYYNVDIEGKRNSHPYEQVHPDSSKCMNFNAGKRQGVSMEFTQRFENDRSCCRVLNGGIKKGG
jgi:hypothetical protein